MAELQPPDAPTVAAPSPAPPPPPPIMSSIDNNTAAKRQRRPSVRLGEIGDQPISPKPWRFHDPGFAAKTSKSRPLTNLVNGGDSRQVNLEFGIRKLKSKRPTKRVRTNWTTNPNPNPKVVDNNGVEGDNSREEFRDFETENSPVHSIDNIGADFWNGHRKSIRVSESRDHDDGIPPESDSRDRKCGTSRERNFVCSSERLPSNFLDESVRNWLIGLGLGRYAPVFEIHEVDDEILPMLTLEDLKDMGINAVGSRRKMYTAIQKLQKRFS